MRSKESCGRKFNGVENGDMNCVGSEKKLASIPKCIKFIGFSLENSLQNRCLVFDIDSDVAHEIVKIPISDMAVNDVKSLAPVFARHGLIEYLDAASVKAISKAMLKQACIRNVAVISGSGVHKVGNENGDCYAYVWNGNPYWFGDAPSVEFVVLPETFPRKVLGHAADWKITIGHALKGNYYLIVVCVHALSAALRSYFNQPNQTLILVGPSGVGKTTIQGCAQSMIGHPEEVKTMSGTKIGIAETLLANPDAPTFFQDSRQLQSSDDLIGLIFDAADGAARLKNGLGQPRIKSTMILSNERLIEDMSFSGKNKIDEGVYARCLEIKCDAKFGAFHDIHEEDSPAEFAKKLANGCRKYYGGVWVEWIASLSNNWDFVLEKYQKWLEKVRQMIVDKISSQANARVNNRIIDSMAFSAWVGVVASELNIIPLKKSEVVDAFAHVLDQYLSRHALGTGPASNKLIAEVKGLLDENKSKFQNIENYDEEHARNGGYGYYSISKKNGKLYLFYPSVFERIFVQKYGSVAYKLLLDAGFLVCDKSRGNQHLVRMPGTSLRKSFVAIKDVICFD